MIDYQTILKRNKRILQDLNFENIKINAVLLNGINASEKDFEILGENL